MKFGLSQDQYQFLCNTLTPLQQKGAKVWCFGSRARGDFQPFSDLDIMIESELDLSNEIAKISELISNSNFPYKVDLVELGNFAKEYRSSFQRDKILFF